MSAFTLANGRALHRADIKLAEPSYVNTVFDLEGNPIFTSHRERITLHNGFVIELEDGEGKADVEAFREWYDNYSSS